MRTNSAQDVDGNSERLKQYFYRLLHGKLLGKKKGMSVCCIINSYA